MLATLTNEEPDSNTTTLDRDRAENILLGGVAVSALLQDLLSSVPSLHCFCLQKRSGIISVDALLYIPDNEDTSVPPVHLLIVHIDHGLRKASLMDLCKLSG